MPDSTTAFKVKSNGFEFTLDKSTIDAADFAKESPTSFNLLHNHRSVNAILLDEDASGKHLTIEVDGESFEVIIEDDLDQMLEQMGFGKTSSRHIKEVKAPMPGMVLEVNVTAGQALNEGDRLLILSAMKMENSILIHASAVIKKVNVTAGQAVEKGQVLVELE